MLELHPYGDKHIHSIGIKLRITYLSLFSDSENDREGEFVSAWMETTKVFTELAG